jgi:hypothetical protein
MNVFELSAITSPLAGAISGGVCVKSPGTIPTLIGVVLGLVIGLVVWVAAICSSCLMMLVLGDSTTIERLSPFQWLASFVGFLMVAAAPFAAWSLTALVVTRLLPL